MKRPNLTIYEVELIEAFLASGVRKEVAHKILDDLSAKYLFVGYLFPYCDVVSRIGSDVAWCSTHDKLAEHISLNEEHKPVCVEYAKRMGCDCCPEEICS
jgi:hypothetical protein